MSGRYIPVEIKQKVTQHSGNGCEYCRCLGKYALHTFNIDHIIPLSKGGLTIFNNLAYSCSGCNSFKSNKTTAIDPQTQQEVLLFNPRADNWNEHFKWSDNALQMTGLTAIGRATIHALKLNRERVVNFRQLTILSGEHPPKD